MPDRTNSVLVITAGPHTDQSLGGQGLQDFIKQSNDPAKPVAVNVIDFGSDSDRAHLGGSREAVRRQLPEPRDLGVAGAGHRGVQLPELTRRLLGEQPQHGIGHHPLCDVRLLHQAAGVPRRLVRQSEPQEVQRQRGALAQALDDRPEIVGA